MPEIQISISIFNFIVTPAINITYPQLMFVKSLCQEMAGIVFVKR